ncbi:MAG: cytochrome c oxidase subunit II [bacterium]
MRDWFPHNISAVGGEIDGLYALIAAIALAWFVVTQGVMLWFMIRYRRRPGVPAQHVRGETRAELAWLLVPAVIVLGLDFAIDAASDRLWRRVKLDLPAGDLQLAVTGKQFAWTIGYPGADGKRGTPDDFSLDAELHVPAGRDVRVELRSADVLHSFFLPNARLKQDAVPGRTIDVWFNVTEPGRYDLACAELCGFGHTTMKGSLIVHTPEDFAAWMASHAGGAAAAASPGEAAVPAAPAAG